MRLKSIVIVTVVIVSLLSGRFTAHAQGIYSADKNDKKTDNTETGSDQSRDPGMFKDWGDGGSDRDDEPGPGDPIGEGILILSLLSGTYALIKRNVRRKHED